mmetsp:Transcript_108995/g.341017  ORF Transcript_108995/g.341017 Transcript_108995/m.341017 type:complete len:237 (-) Transcript_108995:51-761(-)
MLAGVHYSVPFTEGVLGVPRVSPRCRPPPMLPPPQPPPLAFPPPFPPPAPRPRPPPLCVTMTRPSAGSSTLSSSGRNSSLMYSGFFRLRGAPPLYPPFPARILKPSFRPLPAPAGKPLTTCGGIWTDCMMYRLRSACSFDASCSVVRETRMSLESSGMSICFTNIFPPAFFCKKLKAPGSAAPSGRFTAGGGAGSSVTGLAACFSRSRDSISICWTSLSNSSSSSVCFVAAASPRS